MLPLMASSMSLSVGLGFFESSATADMIWPGWQYPHCGTSSSIQACWTGWLPSAERPSMVVTFFPATLEIGVMQERAASPLMWTVHAPHSAMPQPNFVPVMSSVSRSTQSSGMSGLTSTDLGLPFKVKLMAMETSLLQMDILQQLPARIKSAETCSGRAHQSFSDRNCTWHSRTWAQPPRNQTPGIPRREQPQFPSSGAGLGGALEAC